MKIINASTEILTPIDKDRIYKSIERVARTCYKSEDRITEGSAEKMVKMLITRGHEAMIEHESITVRFICDRGISHEIVRHRIASYAQESTRYCNYSDDKFGNEITVIKPCFESWNNELLKMWEDSCRFSEKCYFDLLEKGASPQSARSVLPSSLKTEIVVTMNLREWRHFFSLRCDSAAHPQMRELTIPLLKRIGMLLPEIFGEEII
jgi:thymidylate synthase (FAD)